MTYKIDDTDKKILKYLIENTRIPFTEIAKKLNVSAGTVHVRVRKMEESGIIKGSSLVVDYEKMNYRFIAYVGILITKSSNIQIVLDKLKAIPNITVANIVSGKFNIFCKIRAQDTIDAKNVIFKIDQIDEVQRTETMISLEETINDKNRLMNMIFENL